MSKRSEHLFIQMADNEDMKICLMSLATEENNKVFLKEKLKCFPPLGS